MAIGIRKAPAPQGLPGYIRIDTVHQGDQDGMKGVYPINAVDIVTQWQLVAAVERISEAYLLPVIALLLEGFPFAIRGFHSDSGSEYVNHDIAGLLEKLRVDFTKSRPRQTNDNALAECKNGAVIRKIMGYSHIPQQHATAINRFYTEVLNPYLNFHRPCYFAVDTIDAKGKIQKTYPHDQIMTPWDRLNASADYRHYLKAGITSHALEDEANALSDNKPQPKYRRLANCCSSPLTVDPNPRPDLNSFNLILRLENTAKANQIRPPSGSGNCAAWDRLLPPRW